MSRIRSKSSSSEDGEIPEVDSDDDSPNDTVPSKMSNKKLWSNVMLDQTADDIVAGVNAFEGNCGNRSVESYSCRRKRKLSDPESGPFGHHNLLENEQPQMPLQPSDSMEPPSRKRKRVIYDVSENNSENEEESLNVVDAFASKTEPTKRHEFDITFEEVIEQSSAFLNRAKQRNMRPSKEAKKREILDYLTWLLNESNSELLERMLELKTPGFVFFVLDKTIKTEKDGGILTNTGIRRRLPGGVFISILKSHLSQFERLVILDGKTQIQAKNLCSKRTDKKNRKRAAKQKLNRDASSIVQTECKADEVTAEIVEAVMKVDEDLNEVQIDDSNGNPLLSLEAQVDTM